MSDPTRFTPSLTSNDDGLPAYSDGYRLIDLAHKYVKVGGRPLVLDVWQQRLLIRLLEKCPPGHAREGQLRFRQVVVSVPRQNGKSLIAALLSLYGLLQHHRSPRVLGLARGVEQARIVYGYTKEAINSSSALNGLLRQTETRGISNTKTGGTYKVLPAKTEAIQGYLSTLAMVDELHVLPEQIWNDIVTSQKAQTNSLIIGITTAGDINSSLLKRLYQQGQASVDGESETFGFFCWEAPQGAALSIESLTLANPAIACGRIDAAVVLEDERHSPESNWRRYALNQFWEGQAEPWVPTEHWYACKGLGVAEKAGHLVYAIDVTPGWQYGSVSVARKTEAGLIETTKIASLVKPDLEQLVRLAAQLRKHGPCSFVMDTYVLGELSKRLEAKGYSVMKLRQAGNQQAASMVYGLISRHKVSHNADEVIMAQFRDARTKYQGDAFRIVRGTGEIDALMSMVYAVYGAAVHKKKSLGIA